MNVRKLRPDWVSDWNEFCRENSHSWFRHTVDWLDYSLSYTEDHDPVSKSFVVTYGKEIIGGCPLLVTTHDGRRELSFGGDFGPAPVVGDDTGGVKKENVERRLFGEIERIACESDVSRVGFSLPTLSSRARDSTRSVNRLHQYGYLDASLSTRVINLQTTLDALKNDFRHSYIEEIQAAGEMVESAVYDAETIEPDVFDEYRRLHHKDAGRVTRPLHTFDLMYEWICAGDAFLVAAKHNGEFVEFAYYIKFDDNVYYASAASDPAFNACPTGHFVQWQAIKWMQDSCLDYYELGPQHYAQQLSAPSTEKDRDISFFKRGFGGFDIPLFRGEKYYDPDYFEEVYGDRVSEYVASIAVKD